jgi:hypothetical protein
MAEMPKVTEPEAVAKAKADRTPGKLPFGEAGEPCH